MSFKVLVYGDPALWKKSKKVAKVDDEIKSLLKDLIKTMYAHNGVGLSAPQVGIHKRVIVVDIGTGLTTLVNPKILSKCGKQSAPEGCLSVPGVYIEVKRADEITVEGLDKNGMYVQIEASGLFARALQHEIDHLDGILITEKVPKKRLKAIKDELEKLKKGKGDKSG
ncbi:MAG: peptide deformylase [bacterium]